VGTDETFTSGRLGLSGFSVTKSSCSEARASTPTFDDGFLATAPPTLALSVSSLDFGEVKIKQQRKLSFTIWNTGEQTQNVTVSTITPFNVHSEPFFNLKPGHSRTVEVHFAPPIVSGFIGLVEMTSGDHSVTLTLVGTGVL
jgi:hypothetical protein